MHLLFDWTFAGTQLDLTPSCGLGSDLFNMSVILLGPASYLGHMLLVHISTRGQPQPCKDILSLYFCHACLPFSKVGYVAKSKFPGQGSTVFPALVHSALSTLDFLLYLSKSVTLPSQSLYICQSFRVEHFSLKYLCDSYPPVLKAFAQLHLINEDFQDSTFWWLSLSLASPLLRVFITTQHTYIVYLFTC